MWRSNRDVITLSTDRTHSENIIDTGNCDRTEIRVLKPKSIIDYNKAKQGIDLSDQYNFATHREGRDLNGGESLLLISPWHRYYAITLKDFINFESNYCFSLNSFTIFILYILNR